MTDIQLLIIHVIASSIIAYMILDKKQPYRIPQLVLLISGISIHVYLYMSNKREQSR
jgi:hypothetical protein